MFFFPYAPTPTGAFFEAALNIKDNGLIRDSPAMRVLPTTTCRFRIVGLLLFRSRNGKSRRIIPCQQLILNYEPITCQPSNVKIVKLQTLLRNTQQT